MITLAIETSGRAGSIALRRHGELCGEVELTASGRRHARTVVPEIGTLLQSHGLRPQEVELLAVSIGPGSFTGLRVGVVCAKTFAYAVGCPIVGVDSFLAVAAVQPDVDHVWVIEDALRGDVCAGEYRCVNGRWNNVTRPQLVAFDAWKAQLPAGVLLCGPGLDQFGTELAAFPLSPPELRTPRASAVAVLGEQAAAEGKLDDPWTLEPFYMRRSAAEEKADAASATA
ncbi:tRNA (adenosine(37)-N6)-threonylcarbamoyltransferase complex dimerization subunit type 1 TsaB [Planctomicrobium sp. SH661]|uniref:tRNA (adenosine(37)-N6)-threonylcarbamoyltransferase complex dimerization subunit type 1 TsaB n=1 Tax=Planctomicrobium sp. SH661 TaxID=3448124 RepID=UPI003F5C18D6